MRPRRQEGQVKLHGNQWVLAFYKDVRDSNGTVQRKRVQEFLAPYAMYPVRNPEQVREKLTDKIASILRPVNAGVPTVAMLDGMLTVEQFITQRYWPRCEQRQQLEGANHMEPSTIHGYRKIFKKHILGKPIASIPINRLTTKDGQDWLDSLPQNLSHKTHLRVRAFMSGVLTAAIQANVISGVNPMDATKAGGLSKGRKESELTPRELKIRQSNKHAYEHAEVALMLDKLPEPARTICSVAAFTGLTRSEIPALKWEDYDGKTINVVRKKWREHIGAPKTEAREAGVPVAPLLGEILSKYKKNKQFPPVEGGWMFYGQKEKKPIDMDNLSRREIPGHINGAWYGWHAFRRGLGTRLNDMGMNAVDIQKILRHANIATTLAYYTFPNPEKAKAGLRKLTETVRKKYAIKA
jgi:integrase